MSIREFTQQQFADGTTIDGDRLSEALLDLDRRFNQIPDGDLFERRMQTQIVLGWSPPTAVTGAAQIQYPWLNGYQALADASNPQRLKGVTPINSGATGWYAMTMPLRIHRPAILHGLDALLVTGNSYYNAATSALDIQWLVTVDNPFLSDNQRKNSKIVSIYPELDNARDITHVASLAPDSDMVPNFPNSTLDGAWIRGRDLNIPLPAGARIRFCLCLKVDQTAATKVWSEFSPSVTVTLLEGLSG